MYLIIIVVTTFKAFGEDYEWRIASTYEHSGLYEDAIEKYKQLANKDKNTEWYICDITDIVRCFANLNNVDSTLYYGNIVMGLEDTSSLISSKHSEECIQNVFWSYLNCSQYESAINVGEKVLELRGMIYEKASNEYLEWIGVMEHQAYKNNDISKMCHYCEYETKVAEEFFGFNSEPFENAISSIRGYAHAVCDEFPDFTNKWLEPYYNKLVEKDILPQFQYEYEIILLSNCILLGDLKSADEYAHKLRKWISTEADVPLNDKVRIYLKLAYYFNKIGDDVKARLNIEDGWKLLEINHQSPELDQLIDRHIIEREMRYDMTLGYAMNTEWLIETSTPIITSNYEDSDIRAFFYESLAYAYGEQKDYELAIANIKHSIDLNPLISRRKKLAQLYLESKCYDLAEKEYLDIYNIEKLSEHRRKGVESDLAFLYWASSNRKKLESFLTKDFENMKSEIRANFAFLNESERENFLEKSLIGTSLPFDMYTAYSKDKDQWNAGNEMAYNLAIIQKGLLLSTSKDVDEIFKNAPDSIQSAFKEYEQFQSLLGIETDDLRQIRIDLMEYATSQLQFLQQLSRSWKDVYNELKDNEAAIEFINLCGVTPNSLDEPTPSLGALILRKDFSYPVFVNLGENSKVEDLYKYDDGDSFGDFAYVGDVQKQLYQIIWEPLLPYLKDITTVYYAPVGILQEINLDWIGMNSNEILTDKYDLYRLSSTYEICNKNYRISKDVVLYGDIAYSIEGSPLNEAPESKYRSTSRSGFLPLKGTQIELDSISEIFHSNKLRPDNYRRTIATEESFREFSGKSPKIIHIATHGFYYSDKAIAKEHQKRNFISFQGIYPELYHSGLALAGAQDTWKNDTGDITKYIESDPNNDGILLSAEIAKLDLSKTDLVVLSACETALGKVTSEGVYGLQRAFKLAGVNSIIMSLWKVDDDATQLLMTSFYKNYLNGMSKREALLTAQKKVRATTGFEDPYYWAAFILLDGLN